MQNVIKQRELTTFYAHYSIPKQHPDMRPNTFMLCLHIALSYEYENILI